MTQHQDRVIRILGVPMDLGQNRRGVDMGPSALRAAGLQARLARLGHDVHDMGNVPVLNPEEDRVAGGHGRLQAVASACQVVYDAAREGLASGEMYVFLGGDHSVSIGSVAAAAYQEPVGVIWIDAHADFNTPATSASGNIHGMPLAALAGDGHSQLVDLGYPGAKVKTEHVVVIGARDVEPAERKRLAQRSVTVYTMRQVDESGIAVVARQALERLQHLPRLHVSLDMDSLDPDEAPGVGTPVPGGLTYREAHLIMEILADSHRIHSLDIVEINPILDDRNRTAELAVGLAASLLGERIL